jgi:hypothetical protein
MVAAVKTESRLDELEQQHENSRLTAIEALRAIHDEGLYKLAGHKTWEEYLKKRWDYSKTYGKYLLDFSRLREQCREGGVEFLPENESQTRPIVAAARRKNIDPVNAWQIAVDTAPKIHDVPQITRQHVESSMAHFGIHGRKSAPKKNEVADELRSALVRLSSCKALKMSGHDFVEKHGSGAFPRGFHGLVDWLTECAEVADAD